MSEKVAVLSAGYKVSPDVRASDCMNGVLSNLYWKLARKKIFIYEYFVKSVS